MSIVMSLSVGEGDMFYIKHNTDNFTMIDCCMDEDNKRAIVELLRAESKDKGVVRFISTHPDGDHIKGLAYLNRETDLLNFYCVDNETTMPDETEDFKEYCTLRDDSKKAFYLYRGCARRWLNLDSEERKSAGISVLWPVLDNRYFREELDNVRAGMSPNNICPIIKYGLKNGVAILWMGDLMEEFMEKIELNFSMDAADILFAAHHGRDKVPDKWLKEMNPKMVVIGEAPSEDVNYYMGYNTITQNSAGHITLECLAGKTHVYVSNRRYSVNFLENQGVSDTYGKYIGTLLL